jgi:hypothetical protein
MITLVPANSVIELPRAHDAALLKKEIIWFNHIVIKKPCLCALRSFVASLTRLHGDFLFSNNTGATVQFFARLQPYECLPMHHLNKLPHDCTCPPLFCYYKKNRVYFAALVIMYPDCIVQISPGNGSRERYPRQQSLKIWVVRVFSLSAIPETSA